jgi:hypothetical protein
MSKEEGRNFKGVLDYSNALRIKLHLTLLTSSTNPLRTSISTQTAKVQRTPVEAVCTPVQIATIRFYFNRR